MISFRSKSNPLFEQIIPIGLTMGVFCGLWVVLSYVIRWLNLLPGSDIALQIRWRDILVGATIYFKTSVDFAILIGLLMKSNPGWKNRIAIEVGTALGNGAGTMLILCFWVIFKQLHFLLALMIILSTLVLFELAESGLKHFDGWRFSLNKTKRGLYNFLKTVLGAVLKFTRPLTSRILPNFSKTLKGEHSVSWIALLVFALTTPFILGLDDFAGYVPLFSVVNVFGFALGVMGAHMLLNIGLFASPDATIKWFKNQWVSFVGTVAFMGLAVWGIIEALRIII